MNSFVRITGILALLFAGCGAPPPASVEKTRSELPVGAEAFSLEGRPLFPVELSPAVRANHEEKLAEAQENFADAPGNAHARIWLGRRTAYLGRYRDAIEIFSVGIEEHPHDARFLRHRGHRYISMRQFELAIADLERGTELIAGLEDQIEPDGLPNARNIPTSTLQSNLWYHLGLAYYLTGELEQALRAYRECMKVSKNPDMLVATSHWLYMTLRRLGRDEDAAAVVEPIATELDIIENEGYHQLLLLYKGELKAEEILEMAAAGTGLEDATLAYGVANWHFVHARSEQANSTLRRIIQGSQWAAFGYIAAEADLHRNQKTER